MVWEHIGVCMWSWEYGMGSCVYGMGTRGRVGGGYGISNQSISQKVNKMSAKRLTKCLPKG